MPSKSPAQHRLMEAAAHTKGGFGGVPQKVGKEFVKADKMAKGGVTQSLKKAGFYEENKSKPERLKIVSHVTTKPERVKIVEKVFSSKKMKTGGSAKQAATAIHMKMAGVTPKKSAGGSLKEVPSSNKGLPNLPEQVRHKMGYMAEGGLYANINAKRERIAHGSKEHMRKPGAKGAPTAEAFKDSAKTAKMKSGGKMMKSCW